MRQMEYNSHGTVGNRGPSGRVPRAWGSSSGRISSSPVVAAAAAAAAAAARGGGGGGGEGGAPSGAGSPPVLSVGAEGFSPYSSPSVAGSGAAGGSVHTPSTGAGADSFAEADGDTADNPVDDVDEEEEVAKEPNPDRWTNAEIQASIANTAKSVMKHVPSAREDGILLAPGAKERDLLRPPAVVAAEFNKRFPEAPLCRPLESPEKLAEAAMNPAATTKAMEKRAEKILLAAVPGETTAAVRQRAEKKKGILEQLRMEAAMAVFATMNVVFALYMLEVVFFDILVKIPRFQASQGRRSGRATYIDYVL